MKRIIFGKEARERLKAGSDAVANAVKVTLGPLGRNVIISEYHGAEPSATKDGVSVARSIQLEDPIENVGAQIIKGVARKTVDDAGDGTTTATVSGSNSLTCASEEFKLKNNLTVNGINVTNGSVITIGGTQVTIEIYEGCQSYPC